MHCKGHLHVHAGKARNPLQVQCRCVIILLGNVLTGYVQYYRVRCMCPCFAGFLTEPPTYNYVTYYKYLYT